MTITNNCFIIISENKFITFEGIKHIDDFGEEFWYARELMPILQYAKWQNFKKIIDKHKQLFYNSDKE